MLVSEAAFKGGYMPVTLKDEDNKITTAVTLFLVLQS